MDQNWFFRTVWRFNAILLALGGILIVAGISWTMFSTGRWEPTPHGEFAPVPKDAEKDSTYRLETTSVALKGENVFSLHKWNGSPQTYGLSMPMVARSRVSYFSALNGVNLLAVDSSTGVGHWLFHGYQRAVLSDQGLTRDAEVNSAEVPPALILVIQTIDADTNKDGELTEKDTQSLYVYRAGTQFAEKFLDADYIISREQTSADSFLVVYERGKSAVAATYSIPDFKLKSEKPIPSVPN
jgi:hypothetical protein